MTAVRAVGPLAIAFFLAPLLTAGCEDQPQLPLSQDGAGQGELSSLLVLGGTCVDHPQADRLIQGMLEAVNKVRARHELQPLELNSALMHIADFYACRLVDGRFFDHVDPLDGSTLDSRAADFGYAFAKVGENLAAGQATAGEAIKALMASERHRANILDPDFTELGIAVKAGGPLDPYWVQEFGRPLESPTLAAASREQPAGTPPSGPSAQDDSATQPSLE